MGRISKLVATSALAGLLAAATLAGIGPAPGAEAQDQPRPNIVVVMTDDQTQASLAKMPIVSERIAARGATFPHSLTNWPLCCPSRVTFYSGQYAHNHGVLGNGPPDGGWARFNDTNALPIWLQQAGYKTIHVGKYLNGYGEGTNPADYVPPGWNEWYAATGGTQQTVYDYRLNQNGNLVDYGQAVSDFKQDVFSDLAVNAIERHAPGDPFFLGVMYTAPHSGGPNPNPHPPSDCQNSARPAPRHAAAFDAEPLPTPPSFNEADASDKPAAIQALPVMDDAQIARAQRRHRCRLESLLSVDEGVGRILDTLEAAGELDQTLVVFTSDNGFFAGEHRIQTGKNRVYEEAVRVPLVMRGPEIPEGVQVADLAINADLTSTVLDAADATPGLAQDGRSLLPFAEHPGRLHGRELLLEKGNVLDGADEDEVQTGAFAAIRTLRYVYVENATGEIELYDLETDPYQLQNQRGNPAYAAAEASLAARLARLKSCAGQSCRSAPAIKLKLPRKIEIVGGKSCRPANEIVARIRGPEKNKVLSTRYAVGEQPAGRDDSVPFEKRIRPRLVRRDRTPTIRAFVELVDGRDVSFQKQIRVCPER